MPHPFIGDMETSKVRLSPVYNKDGRTCVDLHREDGGKIFFQLCEDWQHPFPAKYALDSVRDDASDRSRRGQAVLITCPRAEAALRALDEAIIRAAVAHSKEWFKSKAPLSEDTIRDRYAPILNKGSDDDGPCHIKFKVKTSAAKFPTTLHRVHFLPGTGTGKASVQSTPGSVSDLELRGVKLAPNLSTYGLWFMAGGTKFGVSLQAEEIIYTPGVQPSVFSNFTTKHDFEIAPATAEGGEKEEDDAPSPKRARVQLEGDEDACEK